MKRRPLLDLLVSRHPDLTREELLAFVLSGEVLVNGERIREARRAVPTEAEIRFEGERYVSRGGYKLEHALDYWEIPVVGKVFLDAGSSTGGFTDCLLQRGAAAVHAVDVGRNQLAYRLRRDSRVIVHEQTNIMDVQALDPVPAAAVCDLSFRSAVGAVQRLLSLVNERRVMALVKPQFEIDPDTPGFDGVVRDSRLLEETLRRVVERLEAAGIAVVGATASPVRGRRGNREFLFLLRPAQEAAAPGDSPSDSLDADAVLQGCLGG